MTSGGTRQVIEERDRDAVGMPDMEAEHEFLIALLHELQEELAAGRRNSLSELLSRFEAAANAHFMEEQSLMRLHAYPGYAAHEQEHDALIVELRELSKAIDSGEIADLSAAASRLDEWLMTHMKTTDEALENYLREAGIRPSGHA